MRSDNEASQVRSSMQNDDLFCQASGERRGGRPGDAGSALGEDGGRGSPRNQRTERSDARAHINAPKTTSSALGPHQCPRDHVDKAPTTTSTHPGPP